MLNRLIFEGQKHLFVNRTSIEISTQTLVIAMMFIFKYFYVTKFFLSHQKIIFNYYQEMKNRKKLFFYG
jgi:hypothetical protein